MALAADIMKGGTSAGQAQAINGQVSPTVTAAGTVIGDAFDLIHVRVPPGNGPV